MKNNIKFVYFDIGGVLVKDFSATNKWNLMTNEWGISEVKKEELNKLFHKFEDRVCIGEKDVEEFLPMVEKRFGVKFPKNYSILKDFIDRFKKNEGIWKIVDECKKKYRIGLLTNMYPRMLNLINEKKLLSDIKWNEIIDSSIYKIKKPEKEIYVLAEELAKTPVNEILFIDNKEENLIVSRERGWQTFWFDSQDYEKSNQELEEFLG